jgi:hypothetical protein
MKKRFLLFLNQCKPSNDLKLANPQPSSFTCCFFSFLCDFPFSSFLVGFPLLCCAYIYVRSSSAQVFYLFPSRERSGGRHVKNIHVDTGEVRKAIGQPSQRQIWRVSLRIFFLLLRIICDLLSY